MNEVFGVLPADHKLYSIFKCHNISAVETTYKNGLVTTT